jgi:hypothetical protein
MTDDTEDGLWLSILLCVRAKIRILIGYLTRSRKQKSSLGTIAALVSNSMLRYLVVRMRTICFNALEIFMLPDHRCFSVLVYLDDIIIFSCYKDDDERISKKLLNSYLLYSKRRANETITTLYFKSSMLLYYRIFVYFSANGSTAFEVFDDYH